MTRGFDQLSWSSQLKRLREAAGRVLATYPLTTHQLRLVKFEDNAVYRVTTSRGHQFALRLLVGKSTPPAALASELQWLQSLSAETGLNVPSPVLTSDGDLIVEHELGNGWRVLGCLLTWLPGRPLTRKLTAPNLRRAGQITARLHDHAEHWSPPIGFSRPRWEADGLAEQLPGLLRNGASVMNAEDRLTTCAAFDKAQPLLEQLGSGPGAFGLVHADLNPGNFVVGSQGLGVIDFDDCGWSYYLYDLATMLSRLDRHVPDPEERYRLAKAYRTGYTAEHPLPDNFDTLLPTLIAFRHLMIVTFVLSSGNQRVQKWAGHDLARRAINLKAYLHQA